MGDTKKWKLHANLQVDVRNKLMFWNYMCLLIIKKIIISIYNKIQFQNMNNVINFKNYKKLYDLCLISRKRKQFNRIPMHVPWLTHTQTTMIINKYRMLIFNYIQECILWFNQVRTVRTLKQGNTLAKVSQPAYNSGILRFHFTFENLEI